MLKKDNLKLGIILGLITPLFGMLFFYFWKFKPLSFWEFIQYLGMEKRLITSMISISLMANAVLFTIYINTRKDNTAKGIFISTCIYAIAAITLKLTL